MGNCYEKRECTKHSASTLFNWLPAFIIAILPKCPFCLMAYSGALTLCSGNKIYPNQGGVISYVSVGLAVLILLSILYNKKGKRTLISALIAAIGIGCIICSQFIYVNSISYAVGSALLIFGIWYNGSFFYFYNKLNNKFRYNFLNSNKHKL